MTRATLQDLLDRTPPETHRALQGLWGQMLSPPEGLVDELEAYMNALQRYTHREGVDGFLDEPTARLLFERCLTLLEQWDSEDQTAHRLVEVAIRYFVMRTDAEDDSASITGFDDDVAVFNAVVDLLGLRDLRIVVPGVDTV